MVPCVPTLPQAPVVRPEEPVVTGEKHETWKVAGGSKRFKCNECGKWFPQKSNLNSHKRSHIQGNNTNIGAPCPKCKTNFQNSEQLEYHTNKEHIGLHKVTESKTPHKKVSFSEIHNCPRCEEIFKTKDLLNEHLDKVHMDIEPEDTTKTPTPTQFHCAFNSDTMCPFQCDTKDELERHIESNHNKNTQFQCSVCLFQCDTKEELHRHIDSNHNKKTQLQCSVCILYFKDLDALAKHMNMAHIKESDLIKCNQCGKSMIDKTKLREHLNESHPSYKPCTKYKTDSCNETMCRFSHIKLQPNQDICYKCGTIYLSKKDLINHIKKQHGNIVCHKFIQNQCDRSSEDCIFSHRPENVDKQTNIHQDFPQGHPIPLHSPLTNITNMSEHIQSQLQLQSPQMKEPHQVHIMNMIHQIVAQVVTALTMHLN